ncbi:hypothetical protein KDL29_10610 [bacterium]|nr:hypothetical protein [bacterium]
MFRFLTVLATVLLLSMQVAFAQEGTFSFVNGPVASYEHMAIDGHQTYFPSSMYGNYVFADGVSFYCRRYGDVGDLIGSVVVFGPQTDRTRRIEDIPDSAVVYSTSLFNLKDCPEDGGWFHVPIDLLQLPEGGFSIVLYTRSNDERGLDIGLAPSAGDMSHSYTAKLMTKEQIEKDPEAGLLRRNDRMDWMISVDVKMDSGLGQGITSNDLVGSGFAFYDDGSAEGWEEFARSGAMVRFENSSKRSVDAVYLYAKLGADWFGTDRNCSVVIADDRLNIIKRMSIPYTAFNEAGSWAKLDVPDREVTKTFYVIVQPHSEADVKFLLGADLSGNKASSVGITGAMQEWSAENSEADTNWMVRVHYSR